MKKRSNCAINHALEIFGDKWTLLIIREMVFKKRTAFSEFKKISEGIATNILSDRLSRLENYQLIEKCSDETDGRRATYLLTKSGLDLIPVLLDIMVWSFKHDPSVSVSAEIVGRIQKDRAGFIHEIESSLTK